MKEVKAIFSLAITDEIPLSCVLLIVLLEFTVVSSNTTSHRCDYSNYMCTVHYECSVDIIIYTWFGVQRVMYCT